MKLKNIPADINSKSIKEAQKEIKEIIVKLESSEMSKIEWTEQYERMMQLNNHIGNEFRKKADEIKKSTLDKSQKISSKHLK